MERACDYSEKKGVLFNTGGTTMLHLLDALKQIGIRPSGMSVSLKGVGELVADSPGGLILNARIAGVTKSGRPFRYNISNWEISALTPSSNLDDVAGHIVAEKFRSSEWDLAHPRVNVTQETREAIRRILCAFVEMQEARKSVGPTK